MSDLEKVTYQDGETELTGLVARPAGKPRAAIAVYPTIHNTSPFVEDKARKLAEAGYLALITDFYGEQPTDGEHARQLASELRPDPHSYRQRLRAGLKALVTQPEFEAGMPVAAIGFCMGGQAVLELARDGAPLAAVVSFHGLFGTALPAEHGKVTARILVCHGDADPMVPHQQVLQFWEEMTNAGANWHFHSYSGVKHGFTNPNPPAGADAVAYDASADRQSWAAMHSFFDEVFA